MVSCPVCTQIYLMVITLVTAFSWSAFQYADGQDPEFSIEDEEEEQSFHLVTSADASGKSLQRVSEAKQAEVEHSQPASDLPTAETQSFKD